MTTPAHIDTPAAAPPASGGYKWYVLTLAALTHALVMGMPTMALPVLFDEIAAEFDLQFGAGRLHLGRSAAGGSDHGLTRRGNRRPYWRGEPLCSAA